MRGQSNVVKVKESRVQVDSDPNGATVRVKNQGPDSVYYGSASVSSLSNDGTLTSGSSLVLSGSKFFVSAGKTRLLVERFDPPRVWVATTEPSMSYGDVWLQPNEDGTLSIYWANGT